MESISLKVCQVDQSKIPIAGLPAEDGNPFVSVVTWIPDDQILQIGLPRGSICGVLKNNATDICPETFVQNRDFIEILHYLNANHLDPGLVEFSQQTVEPSVAIIDQRSPDVNAAVPAEDIIGLYEIEERRVARYQANPNYRLVTARGIFRLTPWLRNCLQSAVLSN